MDLSQSAVKTASADSPIIMREARCGNHIMLSANLRDDEDFENLMDRTSALLGGPSKRQIKRSYLRAEIGISDAVPTLMFDHGMECGEALRYLMETARAKTDE